MQRVREGGQAIGVRRYAGFWIRFVALVIDGILLFVVGTIIGLPLRMLLGVSAVSVAQSQDPSAVMAALPIAMMGMIGLQPADQPWSLGVSYGTSGSGTHNKGGDHPAKLALGLQIIRSRWIAPLLHGEAVGRLFREEFLSAIILYIGFIMAGLDPEKRSLHDRICNTLVIYSK